MTKDIQIASAKLEFKPNSSSPLFKPLSHAASEDMEDFELSAKSLCCFSKVEVGFHHMWFCAAMQFSGAFADSERALFGDWSYHLIDSTF